MIELSKEDQYKIKMIAVLEDVQHKYMFELQPKVRQVMKQMLNRAELATRSFIKEYDKIEGEDAEKMGDISDIIRDILDEKFCKKEADGIDDIGTTGEKS